jgi:hypothetical protein
MWEHFAGAFPAVTKWLQGHATAIGVWTGIISGLGGLALSLLTRRDQKRQIQEKKSRESPFAETVSLPDHIKEWEHIDGWERLDLRVYVPTADTIIVTRIQASGPRSTMLCGQARVRPQGNLTGGRVSQPDPERTGRKLSTKWQFQGDGSTRSPVGMTTIFFKQKRSRPFVLLMRGEVRDAARTPVLIKAKVRPRTLP